MLRKSNTDNSFWLVEGYYDFIKPQSSDSSNPPQLVVSDHTPAAKTITVKCSTEHAFLSAPGDACTVLERHTHLILLFVRWKAMSQLSALEMEDPSPLNTRPSSFEITTERAGAAYKEALARSVEAEADSAQISWKMDSFDRIY